MSASRSGTAYFTGLTNNPEMKTYNFNRFNGVNLRPVLKEKYDFTYADKKDIIVRHIDELAVDLGLRGPAGIDLKLVGIDFEPPVGRSGEIQIRFPEVARNRA